MPTATPFTALGAGNGLPFCCVRTDQLDSFPYSRYDLCPETFTLEEVMHWFWNGHDYTSTAISWGRYRFSIGEFDATFTWYLSYSDANAAYGGSGDLDDFGQGLAFANSTKSARNIKPHERVCTNGARLVFTELNDRNYLYFNVRIYVRILYDESNDNYKFLVLSNQRNMGTPKYIENTYSAGIGYTETLSLPITPDKSISIPLAISAASPYASTEYRFISITDGELDFYTYS